MKPLKSMRPQHPAMLKRSPAILWALIFAVVLGGFPRIATCAAQKDKPSDASGTGASKTDPKKQIEELKKFQGKLVTVFEPGNPDTGDYIACKFTIPQLMALRPVPEVVRLSAFDEEVLKGKVIAEALSQANAGAFDKDQAAKFVDAVSRVSFAEKTPSEALATGIYLLSQATAPSQEVRDILEAAEKGPDALLAPKIVDQSNWSEKSRSEFRSLQITGSTAAERLHSFSLGLEKLPPADATSSAALSEVKTKVAAAQATIAATGPQAVVETARTTTSAFQRPNDIACAMSILDWNTTRYGFGVTVADQYIGIQVVVRNLSPNLEFLVHDAELAVDTDLNGRHGGFFSGIDKLTVRGYSLASKHYGRRNLIVNMAQGAGTILSAVTPIYGDAVKNASAVYNSGFLGALTNVWKDSNTDQLNLLNDVGFSASKTDRTVVPKSGTAMFVIFVESKPLQQVWWAQPCAKALVLSKLGGTQAQTGVDIEAAKAICLEEAEDTASVKSDSEGTINYIRNPKSVAYRDWSSRAKEIFRELAFTVIAGTHVIEQKDTNPSLTNVDCPKDTKGDLDLSKAANGKFTCSIAGANLDKMAALRLRNSQNKTDTKTADGAVKGDTVTFSTSDLCALENRVYGVFIENKDGAETGNGTQKLNIFTDPSLTDDPAPSQVALDTLLAKGASMTTVKLTGCHLAKVTAVRLQAGNITMDTTKPLAKQTATELSFDVTPEMVTKAKIPAAHDSPLDFQISLLVKDAKNTFATEKHLQGTGTVTAGAPAGQKLILGLAKAASAGKQANLTVTATDATGKRNAAFTGTVKFTNSDKSASPLPDYTFTATNNGSKTFSVTFKTRGKQTITVTSKGLTSASATTVVK
jgi:ssDNA-binding Zn-finger/Zn-ribbon topoisomerase 1